MVGPTPMESRRRFEDAVAIVTGGSKGIGLAIASRLAREGARVAINARNEAELEQALRQLEKEGADASAMAGDITQPGVVERIVEAARDRFGRVTHVVQNASEDASYITGSDLVVDGGRLLVGGETVDLIGVHDPQRIQAHLDAIGRAFVQLAAQKKEGGH